MEILSGKLKKIGLGSKGDRYVIILDNVKFSDAMKKKLNYDTEHKQRGIHKILRNHKVKLEANSLLL